MVLVVELFSLETTSGWVWVGEGSGYAPPPNPCYMLVRFGLGFVHLNLGTNTALLLMVQAFRSSKLVDVNSVPNTVCKTIL